MLSQHIFLLCGIFLGFVFVQQLMSVRFELAYPHYLSSQAKSHAWKKNDELAQTLFSRVRVLCWIMTRPENLLKKLQHIRATWAKHCNQVLYMSSQSSDFPTVRLNVSEGRSQLYWKTIRAFQYIHAHHLQHADWFLKADDDTFVVVENLRYLLSQHDTEKPVYFGHRFRPFIRQGYMSGGAGYVLSREALRRFVQGFSTGRCEHFSSVEDMALGRCMETMGVKAGDSRDLNQRETFNPFRPENHLIPPENGKQVWGYSYYKPSRHNSSEFSPIMPEEFGEHLIRDQRPFSSYRISPDPSDSQLHDGAASLQFTSLIFYRVQVRGQRQQWVLTAVQIL